MLPNRGLSRPSHMLPAAVAQRAALACWLRECWAPAPAPAPRVRGRPWEDVWRTSWVAVSAICTLPPRSTTRARALARAVEKLRTLAASPSSPGLRDYSKLLPLQRPARLLQATFPAAICKALLQATASAATCKALETAPSYCLCSDLQGFRDYSKLLPLQRSARL